MKSSVRDQIIDWVKGLDSEVCDIEIKYDNDQLTMSCTESHDLRNDEVRE